MTPRKADWSRRAPKAPVGTTVELDDTLLLPVTPAEAWRRLEDVPLVASCLPGLDPASLTAIGPHSFEARMTQAVMGITANWDLTATIDPDPARKELSVTLAGGDSRLKLKLEGVANVLVRGDDDGPASLDYQASVRVVGSLAAMGAPIIRSIVGEAIARFVSVVGGAAEDERLTRRDRIRTRLRRWWSRLTRGHRSGTGSCDS